MRPLRACAIVLLAAAGARASGAQGVVRAAPPAFEEGLFDLQASGLTPTTIPVLLTPRGRYLLPVRATSEFLGLPVRMVRDSALVHVSRPGGGEGTVQWAPVRMLTIGAHVPLDSDEIVVRDDEIFLAAPRLAVLADGEIAVDLSSLLVTATRASGFPAQLRQVVLAHRAAELRGAGAADDRLPLVNFEPSTGFGVAEWSLDGSGPGVIRPPTTADLRVGMSLHGGILKAQSALRLPGSGTTGATEPTLSYQRVFPSATLVRQVQIGDVTSAGALARSIRGLTLTNAPFVRDQLFGELPFSRPLPPGWEYEVYEGTRLLGYTDASTHTPVSVPLRYGTTPLRVRLYGPAGEMVESAVSYVIPTEQLPPGELLYDVGAGRCAFDLCRGLAYADLRHGFTGWLTAQAGVDGGRDSAHTDVRGYGSVSVLPAPGWAVSLQGRERGYLRASVQNLADGRARGGVTAGVNAAGDGGTPVSEDEQAAWYAQSSLQLRSLLAALGESAVNVTSRVAGHVHGGIESWDVTSMAPVRAVLLELGVQSDPLASRFDTSGRGIMVRGAQTMALARGFWRRIGSPLLRTELGAQRGRLAQWDLSVSVQPWNSFVHFGVRRLAGSDRPEISLGGSVRLGPTRLVTRMVTRSGRPEGGYTATGAVAFGGLEPVTPLDAGGLGLSGVEGRVFHDRDGDGAWSDGDEPVTHAVVQVGGLRTLSDSSGIYTTWNALPYEVVDVRLDSLSLEDPSWVPAIPRRVLRLNPQRYTRIDFPLAHTRELIGRLVGLRGGEAPAGVAVALEDSAGTRRYETRTFSDGAFYLSHVRPGRYRVVLSASSLKALGARQPSVPAIVVDSRGDEVIELPALVMEPAPRAP